VPGAKSLLWIPFAFSNSGPFRLEAPGGHEPSLLVTSTIQPGMRVGVLKLFYDTLHRNFLLVELGYFP